MHASDHFSFPQGLPAGEGRLEVVCGPMFSGKTEELLRRIRRAHIAKLRVALFKPATDTRYDNVEVVSHDKNSMTSVVVPNSKAIYEHIQMLPNGSPVAKKAIRLWPSTKPSSSTRPAQSVQRPCQRRLRVIVAGLDLDYEGRPFGPMPELLALAEEVTKLHAVCVETGRAATFRIASQAAQARSNLAPKTSTFRSRDTPTSPPTQLRWNDRAGGQSRIGEIGARSRLCPRRSVFAFPAQRRHGSPPIEHGHANLDSIRALLCFSPFVGPWHDGHDFLSDAHDAGGATFCGARNREQDLGRKTPMCWWWVMCCSPCNPCRVHHRDAFPGPSWRSQEATGKPPSKNGWPVCQTTWRAMHQAH